MSIMTTSMHHSNILPIVFGAHFGSKWHIDTFGDRQGIHVSAKPDYRPGSAAFQQANNTSMRNPGSYIQPQVFEVFCNLLGRLEFPV